MSNFLRFRAIGNNWFYRSLSASSHVYGTGLMRHAVPLMLDEHEMENRDNLLAKIRSDNFFAALTLLLAIVSEIEANLSFGRHEKIRYLWTFLGKYWGEMNELYQRRYQRLLGGTA